MTHRLLQKQGLWKSLPGHLRNDKAEDREAWGNERMSEQEKGRRVRGPLLEATKVQCCREEMEPTGHFFHDAR